MGQEFAIPVSYSQQLWRGTAFVQARFGTAGQMVPNYETEGQNMLMRNEFVLDSYIHERIEAFSGQFGRKILGISEGFAALIELCSGLLPLHDIDRLLATAVRQSRSSRLEVWDLGYSVRPTGPSGLGAVVGIAEKQPKKASASLQSKASDAGRKKKKEFLKKELREVRMMR